MRVDARSCMNVFGTSDHMTFVDMRQTRKQDETQRQSFFLSQTQRPHSVLEKFGGGGEDRTADDDDDMASANSLKRTLCFVESAGVTNNEL